MSAESPALLRGFYEAREGGLFTACGETSRRRVTSINPDTLVAMTKANEALDRPRFLVAEGNLIARDAVEIGRFNIIAGDAWTCESRLDDIILGARGSEALWSLEATPAAVSFSAGPGAPPEVHAFVGLQSVSEGLALNAGQVEFSATLKPEACIEALTDTTFGWSIEVTSGGKKFAGCAWRGLAAH
ncbi:MAG: hypothetical protein ABI866_09810 [Dokdonella sp.]